jgi:hypothetical protein
VPALLAPAPAARARRLGRARNRVRCPLGPRDDPAPANATHPRPDPRPCGCGQPPTDSLRVPRERAARQPARPRGNQVPRRTGVAGGRYPARRASPPGVPARASARTWDRLAGQTCPPARGLSRAVCRLRARGPVRTGHRPMGQGLDRRGEPGGHRWRGDQAQGRAGRKAERKARDRWLARAGGQGQVPCAGRSRDQN